MVVILCCLISGPVLASETTGAHESGFLPPVVSVTPFILMLTSIAVIPLVRGHWWENNWNKLIISGILGIPMGIYIFFNDFHELLEVLEEYVAFIVYVGSLFTIAGGIVLRGDIKVSPKVNTLIIGIGAILASFIGTPGAAMLLIRPLLRINANRTYIKHTVIFFIFLVCNCGGCLTPLGDPPLFLGYLNGVPFQWTFKLWPEWLFVVSIVLVVYYIWDSYLFRKETGISSQATAQVSQPLRLVGLINFVWLAGVILSVAFLPIFPYREAVMLSMVAFSLRTTAEGLRDENKFTYHPIIEVAFLFIGIFLTMIPALILLEKRGGEFGITEPWQFFWITGSLSAFLDNAPTYLTFFSLGKGLPLMEPTVAETGVNEFILRGISLGAVFMGSMTYIGNGPNFMVKAIADETGIKMPTFLGYMVWSISILIPIFILNSLIFFVLLGH